MSGNGHHLYVCERVREEAGALFSTDDLSGTELSPTAYTQTPTPPAPVCTLIIAAHPDGRLRVLAQGYLLRDWLTLACTGVGRGRCRARALREMSRILVDHLKLAIDESNLAHSLFVLVLKGGQRRRVLI